MFENEVKISKTDKDTLLYHIKQVNEILDKYPYQSCCGSTVTNMSRAKTAAHNAEAWIKNLYIK